MNVRTRSDQRRERVRDEKRNGVGIKGKGATLPVVVNKARQAESSKVAKEAAQTRAESQTGSVSESEDLQLWTCTKCEAVGGPLLFGWRNVPLIKDGEVVSRKRVRQPQCRKCRKVASKRSRDRQRRSEASKRAWARRRAKARRVARMGEREQTRSRPIRAARKIKKAA